MSSWKALLEEARNSWLVPGLEIDNVKIEDVSSNGKTLTLENLGEYELDVIDGDGPEYLLIYCASTPQTDNDMLYVFLGQDSNVRGQFRP